MSELVKTTKPQARKMHRCGWCRTTIKPGDIYSNTSFTYDRRFHTWKGCNACSTEDINHYVNEWRDYPTEGCSPEDAVEWAQETIQVREASNQEQDAANSYLARVSQVARELGALYT